MTRPTCTVRCNRHLNQQRYVPGSCLLALLVLATASFPAAASDTVAITNVTVISGEGASPQARRTVVVRDGRIDLIAAAQDYVLPPGVEEVAGNGGYLIPGFIDLNPSRYRPPSVKRTQRG